MMCRLLSMTDHAALVALLANEPLVANYAMHANSVLQDGRHEVWGYDADGTLGGAVIIALGPFDAEIDSVVVADSERRNGKGHALVAQALTRAKALGKERVLLEVREGNAAAIALYRQLGFSVDGHRTDYYPALDGQGPREAACLMSYGLA